MKKQTKNTKTEEATLLIQTGLSDKEAEIYEIMLKLGKTTVSKIFAETSQKRTTIYAILEELVKKGLVDKDETNPVVHFRARHPYALKSYLEQQVESIKTAENKLDAVLPKFINLYHQTQNRPGVKFFEGKDGVKKVMHDSLTSTTEILTIADIEGVEKYIADIEEEYVNLRNKKGIAKRLLVLDTPQARKMKEQSDHFTADTRYSELKISPFNTVMQLYDNKVSYLTLTDQYLAGMIIEDKFIYSTQKALFEFIWKKTPKQL